MRMSKRPRQKVVWLALVLLIRLVEAELMISRRLSSSYARNKNGYQTSTQNYNSADNSKQYYSSAYYNGARDFFVCDGSVVKVLELYVLCDSPYTFYYGNGANRHSPVCNYGDKISYEVRFRVTDDIQDSNLYATIAIYDDQSNLLASTEPTNLCDEYVGSDCTSAGYYKFSSRMRLPYPSSDNTSDERFLPQVHIAFSTQADSGYNLGAINIECEQWDEVTDGTTWLADRPEKTWTERVVVDYGLFLCTCAALLALVKFLWRQAAQQPLAGGGSGFQMQAPFQPDF